MAVEGGNLSELYQSSKRLLLKSRDGLERLERLEFSSSTATVDSPELSYAVLRDIAQIQYLCVDMDRLWRSVSAKSQRDLWKRSHSFLFFLSLHVYTARDSVLSCFWFLKLIWVKLFFVFFTLDVRIRLQFHSNLCVWDICMIYVCIVLGKDVWLECVLVCYQLVYTPYVFPLYW